MLFSASAATQEVFDFATSIPRSTTKPLALDRRPNSQDACKTHWHLDHERNRLTRMHSPTSHSARSRSSPRRRSRTGPFLNGLDCGLATPSGTAHCSHRMSILSNREEAKEEEQKQWESRRLTEFSVQIQRQETTLAQDPHRHLDDSPTTRSVALSLLFHLVGLQESGGRASRCASLHHCAVSRRIRWEQRACVRFGYGALVC